MNQWEGNPNQGRKRKALILCFDGTGNKFQGDGGDSNIIKIYSMIDRQDPNVCSYYQPGIGTYVDSSALTKSSRVAKLRSWYLKAKDQAVGTSFDIHVVAGYKFLMKNYSAGDDIYMFGFSRGAYTARFLAQMLDYVGLLSAGNEEMIRFAWKTFSRWQQRAGESEEDEKKKAEQFEFMKKFRNTFSRPVRRIRFLGLFDTVNSVPRFENAWMRRTKFPYTAKSTAKVIRHAVAIDERRAKFRQDLISQQKDSTPTQHRHPHLHLRYNEQGEADANGNKEKEQPRPLQRQSTMQNRFRPHEHQQTRQDHRLPSVIRESSPNPSNLTDPQAKLSARASTASLNSATIVRDQVENFIDDDENDPQDIQEIWFPGCHADIGGGWLLLQNEEVSLAHAPLMWMLREARKAGLPFNEGALREANYVLDEDTEGQDPKTGLSVPALEANGKTIGSNGTHAEKPLTKREEFQRRMHVASTMGHIHDSLVPSLGVPRGGTYAWRVMEYLPFRRMDLKADGSWQPIRWPLPFGETRDIPRNAWIHHTALKRMQADEKYRPGNLIVGGGGRGMKIAPKSYGIGEWTAHREEGDMVGEVYVRADARPDLMHSNTA